MGSLLVIGGSGFFGKCILDSHKRGLLRSQGIDEVLILSRRATQMKNLHPELIGDGVFLINSDISTCTSIPYADFVIHAAASTDAKNYLRASIKEKANILACTRNYCKLAVKYHKGSKIVYVSSGAVYGLQPGDVDILKEDDGFIYSIADLVETKRDYALAKRDSEQMIASLGEVGLNVSIARCFSFIGKYLPRDQHFAIGNFLRDGMNKTPIRIKAKNQVYRSYMYADDLVYWLIEIARQSNSFCPTLNVGSNVPIELHELAKIIANIFAVPIDSSEIIDAAIDRYIPSIKRAQDMGLTLRYNLFESIQNTIEGIYNIQIRL